MSPKTTNYSKNLQSPDERRNFVSHGHMDVVNLGDGTTIGRAVFEPGWKWSNDVRPLAGTKSCQAEHHGYCVSGSMVVKMDNGEEFRLETGSGFYIPPGHDAWVDSKDSCVLIDVTGAKQYAVQSDKASKAV
jgi:mannose-6-phosphate isomerase-like protein (cupin superfamily)